MRWAFRSIGDEEARRDLSFVLLSHHDDDPSLLPYTTSCTRRMAIVTWFRTARERRWQKGYGDMSRIIEGSLEILRPIIVGAVKQEEEWDHDGASSSAPTRRIHGEEEENGDGPGEDEEPFADETTDASGSEDEEDESSLAGTITPYEELNEAKWQSKLELLRQYRERNGHCRVPRRYEIDGVKLGSWLSDQRVAYKKHSEGKPAKITQERIDQLEAIGLDFNDTQQKRDEAQWQSKLELLRQYREQNGHCRVPQSYEIDGVKLGSWLSTPKGCIQEAQ